jgi:hypothetical protein
MLGGDQLAMQELGGSTWRGEHGSAVLAIATVDREETSL